MSSPTLWGANNTSNNLQSQLQLSNGMVLANNGAKNYITYNSFENGLTTGYSLGTIGTLTNGIPTGTPTFGSGASGNLTLSAASSSPIAGTYSLSLASSAATTQGNMLATSALAIDQADQAKVLTFQFYYSVPSNPSNGNFSGTSSNSFGIACYDVTNSSWLPVAGNFAMTQNSGVGIATGTMQTNLTTASVRFCIYNVNATSGAITLYFDRLFLGPQTAPYGPIVNDWVTYTPTGTWSANSTYTGKWRRVGDQMEGDVNIAVTGAPTSANLSINLPTGYVIDTTKLAAATNGFQALGTAAIVSAGGGYSGFPTYTTTTAVQIKYQASTASTVTQAAPGTFANGDSVNVFFRVPIVGWSSNVQMSSDTDTRVIAATYSIAGAVATSTTQPINFATSGFDNAGAVTTGAAWKFTAPVTGYYHVEATLAAATSGCDLFLYKNGVSTGAVLCGITTTALTSGSASVQLNAGDYIDLRFNVSQNTNSSTGQHISINRMSGPAVIAATESVNARYFSSSTSVSGSLATVLYTTKSFDSHNAYNAATGIYTAPVSGKYQVNASIAMTGTFVLNSILDLQVQQAGSNTQISETKSYSGGAVTQMNTNLGDTFYLLAGDTIKVQVSNSGTGPAIAATTSQNWFSITRVGN